MKAKEALRILLAEGTLSPGGKSQAEITHADINTPVARAVKTLIVRSGHHSKEQAWMPPSDFLLPLP